MANNIIKDLNKIFIKVFNDKNIVITYETIATDIKNWDSLNNMHLIVAIEEHYGIRIKLQDIQNLKNVGDLCSCIESYISS